MAETGKISVPITSVQESELTDKKETLLSQIRVLQNTFNKEWGVVLQKNEGINNIRADLRKLFKIRMKYMNTDFTFFLKDQNRKDLEELLEAFEAKFKPTEWFFIGLMDPLCGHVFSVTIAFCKIMEATDIQDLANIKIPDLTWMEDVPHLELDDLLKEWDQLCLINRYTLLAPEMQSDPDAPQ